MIVKFDKLDEESIRAEELSEPHVMTNLNREWVSIYSHETRNYTALYLAELETIDLSFETLEELANYMHTEHGDGVEAFNNLQVDLKLDIKKTR